MSNVGQKYAFENGTVPREPLTERERMMLAALKAACDSLSNSVRAGQGGIAREVNLDLVKQTIVDVERSS